MKALHDILLLVKPSRGLTNYKNSTSYKQQLDGNQHKKEANLTLHITNK
jgi:hypothetical protein